jgi:hypothetical protein
LENLKRRDHSEELGVDGRMDIREMGLEVLDWIYLAQVKDWWRSS